MRGLLAACLLACAAPAAAEGLPALFGVTGVAAVDVLNVRAAPDAGTEIRATIAPGATGVEVVALSPDGHWAQVNVAEATGWVAIRFLARQAGPDWTELRTPLACYGTEPFWSLDLDPVAGAATFDEPEDGARPLRIDWSTLVSGGPRIAGFHLTDAGAPAFATVAAEWCSDGMSDREMALGIRYFVASETGNQGYIGCCSLAP